MSNSNELGGSKFQQDFAMLEFFQEEYLYHHKHFWQVLIKLTTLAVVVTVLPLTSEIFGVKLENISAEAKFFFPILGFLISVFSLVILCQEANRLHWVGNAKRRVNDDMPKRYHYGENKARKIKIPLAYLIPWLTFIFELFVIGFCILALCSQMPIGQSHDSIVIPSTPIA